MGQIYPVIPAKAGTFDKLRVSGSGVNLTIPLRLSLSKPLRRAPRGGLFTASGPSYRWDDGAICYHTPPSLLAIRG